MNEQVFGRLHLQIKGRSFPVAHCAVLPDSGEVLVYLTRDEGKTTRTAHHCGDLSQEALDYWRWIRSQEEPREDSLGRKAA